MIFVTVGSQMPFDRLVQAVDRWAGETNRSDVLAQIGKSAVRPRHIRWVSDLAPNEYRRQIGEAELVVAHAGMGTVMSVMEAACPALLLPRRASLHETRNDHQVAAIPWLRSHPGIMVAETDEELTGILRSGGWQSMMNCPPASIRTQPLESLIQRLHQFIVGEQGSGGSFLRRAE